MRTVVLRVEHEVEAGPVGVGGDEDVAPDLGVEAGQHPLQLRVEQVGRHREVARALAVDAVHGQLRRHAPDHPRARHHHAPGAELVQPLHASATVHAVFRRVVSPVVQVCYDHSC
jgi:hypothetical protein